MKKKHARSASLAARWARAELMELLSKYVRSKGLTRGQAAQLMGVSRARIAKLHHGRKSLFTLDLLIRMAVRAGLRVKIMIIDPDDIDETSLDLQCAAVKRPAAG